MGEVRVEIAVQDAAGARIAKTLGASRVELCSALGVGGLTPSIGLVRAVVGTGIATHPLVRSRGGGFVYSDEELTVMRDDVQASVDAGAAGVVIGALTADRQLDLPAVSALVDAAGPVDVTFHRAFDIVPDMMATLDALIDLGVRRVLTSGQAPTTGEGLDALARLVDHAAGRIDIQAGGGVKVDDIPRLIGIGVRDVHLSARTLRFDAGPAGPGGGKDAGYEVTDPAIVEAAVTAAGGGTVD